MSILHYAAQPKIALLGLILLFVLYLFYRSLVMRRKHIPEQQKSPRMPGHQRGPILLNLDKTSTPGDAGSPALEQKSEAVVQTPPPAPSFQTLQRPPSLTGDLLHGALIVLAVIVAVGFVLVLIPQQSFDRMAQNLQAKRAGVQQEQLAFLYLGDEIKEKEFHIRGVVRNITDQQLEKLDAAIRLYAPDGRLLETAVVRMDKEAIAPDDTAEFHLMYPNYEQNIGSYSVDFRWRDGGIVPYKDMRSARPRE